jgi:GDP-4-dehydro-6-deoxy-D-mannose reductase
MRALVTGIAGFVGRHLAAQLLARGDDVHGVLHRTDSAVIAALTRAHPGLADRLHVGDLTDGAAAARIVAAVQPEALFHLAAITTVADGAADPAAAMRVNVLAGIQVLAAVQRHAPACRVLAVGSSEAYGAVDAAALPIAEDCPLRPLSAYGASKAALDVTAYQWAHGAGLDVIRVRPFNHTGPGQRPDFVCPDFARQLVAIARGERAPVMAVGDLDLVRDFSDVRDVVAAYLAVIERGERGAVYNVCSGVGRSIRSVLDTLSEIVGVHVRAEPVGARRRPGSPLAVIGSAAALRDATGWRPRIPWHETLRAVLDDWRDRAAAAADERPPPRAG